MEAKLNMGQAPLDEQTFFPLVKAVTEGNIDVVREFLEQGVDPNYLVTDDQTLMELALVQNHIKIVKLLFLYHATVEPEYLQDIFKMENTDLAKDLITYFIELGNDDDDLMYNICCRLIESQYQGPPALEILKLLLDNGLNTSYSTNDPQVLHYSVYKNRIDFVKLLLKRRANVNGKTSEGFTPLHVAVCQNNNAMVELLLENDALVNEKTDNGNTALHYAIRHSDSFMIVLTLLNYDADLNISGENEKTPLESADFLLEVFIPHLAKYSVKFDQQVCNKNLNHLRRMNKLNKLAECLDELKRMKEYVVYNSISLYDILRMRNSLKRLTYLTMNRDFIANFWTSWNRESFLNYRHDVDIAFREAVRNRDILQGEEAKLNSVFKNFLPDLIIRKVAYINKQYLFC